MKIIECCPFYNETIVASCHIKESEKWIDEFHVTESNRTFKYGEKEYCFPEDLKKNPIVHYQKVLLSRSILEE